MFLKRRRKLNRNHGWDYSSPGFYFFTICVKDGIKIFGNVIDNKMHLNTYGEITHDCFMDIPNHYNNVDIDTFIVMPNHVHGIIYIEYDMCIVGDGHARPLQLKKQSKKYQNKYYQHDRINMMLPKIIRDCKSSVTRIIRQKINDPYFKWQRSYHDHIVRNENELNAIRNYIINNPKKWNRDRNNK